MNLPLRGWVRTTRDFAGMLLVLAAVAFMAHGYLTSDRKHTRTIAGINANSREALLSLDDGKVYSVSLDEPAYHRSNLMLLYPGKRVWVVGGKGACFDITPVKEDNMPTLDAARYTRSVQEGFTDSEIGYSFNVPSGFSNPNPEPPTYGDTISYGAPGVCGKVLDGVPKSGGGANTAIATKTSGLPEG